MSPTTNRRRALLRLLLLAAWWPAAETSAQIVPPLAGRSGVAKLEDQLIVRLRATSEDRQAYIRLVVQRIEQGQFELPRVRAIERYAIKRNPRFPFPYFERAMRVEAERLGVFLPPVPLLIGPSISSP